MQDIISRQVFGAAAVAALLVVQSAGLVNAAPILPGGVLAPAPAEPDPALSATLLQTTGPVAFTAGLYSGSLASSVFVNDTSNPFGPNALTFTYQLVNNPGPGNDSIGRLTVSSFDNFLTDASFNAGLPVGGTPPSAITRSTNGEVMGFTFLTGLQ